MGGSVGWWAHIGGFLCGAALAALAPRRRAVRAGDAVLGAFATSAEAAAGAGRGAGPWLSPRPAGTLLGKPLKWSARWTAVAATVAVCGCFLGVARLQMGHLTAFSAREAAAVADVQRARLTDGRCYGDLLRLLATVPAQRLLGVAGAPQTPRWYAFDRPWEGRVYVLWTWATACRSTSSCRTEPCRRIRRRGSCSRPWPAGRRGRRPPTKSRLSQSSPWLPGDRSRTHVAATRRKLCDDRSAGGIGRRDTGIVE